MAEPAIAQATATWPTADRTRRHDQEATALCNLTLLEVLPMFVNIVKFPPIKPGMDESFRDWFRESNAVYQSFNGFISRRLLTPTEAESGYVAIVEHESNETFMAMHTSPARQALWAKVQPLLDGSPSPSLHEVVESVEASTKAGTAR